MNGRDSQRGALYAAEASIKSSHRLPSFEACQAYVDEVMADEWWKERAPKLTFVKVLSPRANRVAQSLGAAAAITLPEWGWTKVVILHELTHQLNYYRNGDNHTHDALYAWWFFKMVEHYLGSETATLLAQGYAANGVRASSAGDECKGNLKRMLDRERHSKVVWRAQSAVSRDTHVSVAYVHQIVVERGRSLSDYVKAFGGNRNANPPRAPYWQVTYAGGQRWLPIECLKHIDELKPARGGRG